MAIYFDVNGEVGETCPGDDIVNPVNLEEDDLW
jgi:hypothetical protein